MNRVYVRRLWASVILLWLWSAALPAATTGHFIYGEVVTQDGATHEGLLRWDDEEVFWTDHFNGTKADNPNLQHLSDEDREYLKSGRPLVVEHWTDALEVFGRGLSGDDDYTHSFQARFGDLQRIAREGGERVTLHFRNGDTQKLEGGSNDIGATVHVLGRGGERAEVRWRDIEEVRFADTPQNLEHEFGRGNFGTVVTDSGEFTGLVQWDHDERLSGDVLDGEQDGDDVTLSFGHIASIEKAGNASRVTTIEGDSFLLTGTNDVNDDNRGIIVDVAGLGRADIPWKRFHSVSFDKTPDGLLSRADFPKPKPLTGTITTSDGKRLEGRVIFDLDETLDLEFLDGTSEDIDYAIPFRNIKRLEARNLTRSDVTLRNGRTLTLKSADAGADNDGMLVFPDGDEAIYVRWEDFVSVEFD